MAVCGTSERMLTCQQCKAARAYLGWSAEDLASRANVGVATVWNFETGVSDPKASTLRALQEAMEKAGLEFLNDGSASLQGGAGIRERMPSR